MQPAPHLHQHDQGATGAMASKKLIFVIAMIPVRAQNLAAALCSMYTVRTFPDGGAALQAMLKNAPDAVVIDERTLRSQGHGIHKTKLQNSRLKMVPFVIMSDATEGELVLGDDEAAMDIFIKRPFNVNYLFEQIAYAISQSIERSWKSLPPSANRTLKSTADQFKNIAKALATNTPLTKEDTQGGCNPLVKCVRANEHRYVLEGLRDHHNFTYVHSMRVAVFMSVFGQACQISDDEMLLLSTCGFLHDVGKMVMPQTLLNKEGKLDQGEWGVMQNHVKHSHAIVGAIDDINPSITLVAEQHHERIDGTGYPRGLRGGQINELGRMAAVADTFAGLTDKRPYRRAFDANAAFSIMGQMNGALDQNLVRTFREVIEA
ncbi:HD domain-containing phosphohydrolase [Pseudomonadota bacterium]